MEGCARGEQRFVLALDCDCFYAQCEQLRDPSLVGKPVGVRQKMLVITSSYEARAFGILKGDSLAECRRKCPEIIIKDGEDLSYYTATSNSWRAFVESFVGPRCAVEKLGLDEVFVDVTALVRARLLLEDGAPPPTVAPGHVAGGGAVDDPGLRTAAAICEDLRAKTRDALGLTTSGGVSRNKLLAKLAAGLHKPFQQTILDTTPSGVAVALPPDLPVTRVPGIGFATGAKLAALGAATLGELRALRGSGLGAGLDLATLVDLADGVDASPVTPSPPPRTVSAEESFWERRLVTGDRAAGAADAVDALVRKLLRKLEVDQASTSGVRSFETVVVSARRAPETSATHNGRGALTSTLAEGPAAATPAADQKQRPRRESKSAPSTVALGRLPDDAARVAPKLRVVASDLLARLYPKSAELVILSLGVTFPEQRRRDRGQATLSFDARPQKRDASEPWRAPAARDVDADVLAELPADLRAELEAQMGRDAAVSGRDRAGPRTKRPKIDAFFARATAPPPTSPKPPPKPPPDAAAGVGTIVAMGFSRGRATAALAAASGDVARALDRLLAGD